MHILQEHGHTALVAACLPVARTVDKQIVNNLALLVFDLQLVPLVVSRPADGAVGVKRQNVIGGRATALQTPGHRHGHAGTRDPAHQLHILPNSHSAVATF